MRLAHYIDLLCMQLAADFQHGVSVADRNELLEDCVHIAWALSDTQWRAWS